MSSIPEAAMPHAKAEPEPRINDATPDEPSTSERIAAGRDRVVATVKAHPAGAATAATAAAVVLGGLALSAIPALRKRSSEGVSRARKAVSKRAASTGTAKKAAAKSRRHSASGKPKGNGHA